MKDIKDMKEIQEILELRENQLAQWQKETENSLKQAPEGALRVCKHGNRTQYYHRTDPQDFSGTYIPQKNICLAQNLAQKDYDKKLLRAIEKEKNLMKTSPSSTLPTESAYALNQK